MITASSLERELFHSDGQHLSAPRFHESLEARLRRWALSTAYALQPKRIHLMPRVALLTAIHFVEPNESTAELLENPTFHHPEGLVGVSDDLSVESMLSAYKRGIFPISHLGPMKWWSPADRAVLFFKNSHIEKGVRKQIRPEAVRCYIRSGLCCRRAPNQEPERRR